MSSYSRGEEDWYDTLQVCLNGHVITQYGQSQPDGLKAFCTRCGARTITDCPAYTTPMHGYHHMSVLHISAAEIPRFCHACGQAFPWTEARVQAAKDLAEELDSLSDSEKEQLKHSIDDIVQDTPNTP